MMRAKLVVNGLDEYKDTAGNTNSMNVTMNPVAASIYGEGGTDENNTFARYTPNGAIFLTINNPNLFGKFRKGQMFYADFTECSQ